MRSIITCILLLLTNTVALAQDKKVIIDKSITGFTHEFHDGEMVNYTLKPFETYGLEEIYSSIVVMLMPDDMSKEEAIQSVEEEMETGRQQGSQFNDYKKEDISFNGYNATTIAVTAIENNSETRVYMAFVEGNGSKAIFIGEDTDGGKYYDKMKATLKTLQIR